MEKHRDIEAAPPVSLLLVNEDEASSGKEQSETTQTASLLVTWDSPDDPLNPYNWSQPRKWALTLLLSLGGLVTLMASTMMAPALAAIANDLGTSQASAQIFLSIFVLAFAFGPMVLAPLSEVFGRRPVWILSSCFFILWNTVSGFSNSTGLLIASRLLAGIGASVEYAIPRAVLGDTWKPSQRGQSLSISTFIPLLGPALGPSKQSSVYFAIMLVSPSILLERYPCRQIEHSGCALTEERVLIRNHSHRRGSYPVTRMEVDVLDPLHLRRPPRHLGPVRLPRAIQRHHPQKKGYQAARIHRPRLLHRSRRAFRAPEVETRSLFGPAASHARLRAVYSGHAVLPCL